MTGHAIRALAALGFGAVALSAGSASAAPTDPDPSFGNDGAVTVDVGDFDDTYDALVQPDGKVVVAGATSENADGLVVRLRPDGSYDQGFGRAGVRRLDSGGEESLYAVARQSDGRLVVGGETSLNEDGAVYRLKTDGKPDGTFGGDGTFGLDSGDNEKIVAVAVQPDGKIVAVGKTSATNRGDAAVYRINRNGTPDNSFDGDGAFGIDSSGTESAEAVAIQPDGKIVVVGSTTFGNDAAIYRLKPNGELDKSFDGDGATGTDLGDVASAADVAIQPDGKIVVGGRTSDHFDGFVARLDRDGSPDRSFGKAGVRHVDLGGEEGVTALTLQPDGKILGTGWTTQGSDALVFRLNRNGSPDVTFAPGGVTALGGSGLNIGYGVVRQRDGRIILTGTTQTGADGLVYRLQGDKSGAGKPRPTVKGLRCEGLPATIAGTRKGDRIRGTRRRDVIVARGGADRVSALGAGDVVCGGPGDDVLRGGAGRDHLLGGAGRDRLIGGPGRDKLVGGAGLDEVQQ
jgi:uncharacterized delta-60 repeat protein